MVGIVCQSQHCLHVGMNYFAGSHMHSLIFWSAMVSIKLLSDEYVYSNRFCMWYIVTFQLA